MKGIPKIDTFKARYIKLEKIIKSSDFFKNQRRATIYLQEHQKLNELIKLYDKLFIIESQIIENKRLIQTISNEPDFIVLVQEDLEILRRKRNKKRKEVLKRMIPIDPIDSRNTILEIRGCAGGNEASLFAGDLYRMYARFAEKCGWSIEMLFSSTSDCGGFKEVGFLVTGNDVYKSLKYESGVHRVQRVPETETNGRIHTSTATVAVLPEAEEVDIIIHSDDLEMTVCRASGPGGQGVNTTDSAVQILHKPTGIIVNCADERSQQKNKVKAMKVLRSRLLKIKEEEEQAKYAANRRNQIGTGGRSERIRTYNFTQSRLTDHRINYSLYNLEELMEGNLENLIESLQRTEYNLYLEKMLK